MFGKGVLIFVSFAVFLLSGCGKDGLVSDTDIITSVPMVYVQGGTFQMGTPDGGFFDERPVHQVELSGFWMGKYEITQEEWELVMIQNPSYLKGAKRPVERVSWYDAVLFCNTLSERDGLEPVYHIQGDSVVADWSKNGYRLPTEAEWEFAARGGRESLGFTYAGSNDINAVGWRWDNSSGLTNVVGQKIPNELGLYDMSGNVYEWVWDWYGSYTERAKTNPRGASSGSKRVRRGGSTYSCNTRLRASYRDESVPSVRSAETGFRVVRKG